MINNRQAGRRRGRGGQRPPGIGGRPDGGNRIDNRARGNASQLLEKYRNLARDSQMQGDRVTTEYYLQFADHYFRVLNEGRPRDEQPRRLRDEDEDEDGDGFEAVRAEAEEPRREREDRPERRPRRERNEARGPSAEQAASPAAARNADEGRVGEAEPAQEAAAERPRRGRRPRVQADAGENPQGEGAPGDEVRREPGLADRLPPSIAPAALGAEDAEGQAPRRRIRRSRPAEAEGDGVIEAA